MKTIFYSLLTIVLLLPTIVFGENGKKMNGKYTEQKVIKKEFSVNPNALLKIDNSFGNLDITSWEQDHIEIEVNIKVNGNDQEIVVEKLQAIDVNFEASQAKVFAKTIFDRDQESWWRKIMNSWNNSNLKMEINYVVKVPITNSIDLNNDYGSITLDKIKGHAKIHCDYGQIIIGELLANNNSIYIDYSHDNSIKYIKSGEINADYSDFVIENSEHLELNADYSKSKIRRASKLVFNCDYGSLDVGEMGILAGNGDYVGINVESINQAVNIISDYGSITIENLKETTKEVAIKTDYTGVRIGYSQACNFDFRIKTSYGSIKIDDDDLNILKKNHENTSKDFQGYRGVKNSGNTMNISTSYGGVKLSKN